MPLRGDQSAVGALPVVAGAVVAAFLALAFPAARSAFAAIGPTVIPGADGLSTRVDGLETSSAPAVLPPWGIPVRSDTAIALGDVFARHGYQLARVRRIGTVPRLFVARLPSDLHTVRQATKRKALYKRIVLPLILAVNETIAADRRRIERLRGRLAEERPLTVEQESWLAEMFIRHDAPMFDFDELLRRVDVIAPSLAIAQSAEESGWGTSRFAREGNALFGQRTYKGRKGLVPRGRKPGARHLVRAFDRLLDAVRAYAANLNAHPAYAGFRSARADLRRRGRAIDGLELAARLRLYSERRDSYVARIKRIIRIDRLTDFDSVRLDGAGTDLVLKSGN